MKTIFVKPADVEHKWYLIDADGKVLGRLASRVVAILRGKNKPEFTPHWDLGDSVVIINGTRSASPGASRRRRCTIGIHATRAVSAPNPLRRCSPASPLFPWKGPSRACFPRDPWAARYSSG